MVKKEKIIKFIEWFQMFAVIVLPIFLTRKGSSLRNITDPLLVLTIVKIIIEKEIRNLKKMKYLYSLMVSFLGLIYLSLYFNKLFIVEDIVRQKNELEMSFLMFFMITQIDFKEKYEKYRKTSIDIAYLIFISTSLYQWKNLNFPMTQRFSGRYYIFTFTIIASIGALYYLYKFLFVKNKFKIIKIKEILLFMLLFLCNIINNSRMSSLTLILLTLVLFFIKIFTLKDIKQKILIILILFGVAIVPIKLKTFNNRLESSFNLKKDSSNGVRVEIWKNALIGIKKHPIKGNGVLQYEKVIKEIKQEINLEKISRFRKISFTFKHPHSTYLEIFLSLGIIGLLLYLLIIFEVIKKIIAIMREKKRIEEGLSLVLFMYILIIGLSDTVIYFNRVNQIIFYFVGCTLIKKKELENLENE